MRFILTLIACFSLIFSLHAADPKRIYHWQEGPLKWSFFEENESIQSSAPAFSSLGVTYSFDVKNGVPQVSFEAFIDPASSWVKPQSTTVSCLQHEQLLFDVAEWHARKMRKGNSRSLHQRSSVLFSANRRNKNRLPKRAQQFVCLTQPDEC
jgi:hypothetical protein